MKLSKTQEQVLAHAKKDIDKARSLSYPEWLKAENHFYQCDNEYHQKCYREAVEKEEMKKYWEEHRNGIVLTHCNTKTLQKLESYGLIEIIYDSTGEDFGIDTIKVLNY